MLKFLEGKKTYIVAGIVGVLAFCSYAGINVPSWVDLALGALGLGALRSAIEVKK